MIRGLSKGKSKENLDNCLQIKNGAYKQGTSININNCVEVISHADSREIFVLE